MILAKLNPVPKRKTFNWLTKPRRQLSSQQKSQRPLIRQLKDKKGVFQKINLKKATCIS